MKVFKKTKRLFLILGLLLLAVIVFLLIYLQSSSSGSNPPVRTNAKILFNDTSNNSPIGGFLAHMMEPEDFENIVKNDSLDISIMTDCASVNRHTCSAWTYMRTDLPPILFIIPSSDTPTCGVMIDPVAAWSLITTMGVIDSATDSRSCCSNETTVPNMVRWPADVNGCIGKILESKYPGKYTNYAVYQQSANSGGSCPTECSEDDLFCKYRNSGGGVDFFDMVNWPGCYDGSYNNCFDFTPIDTSQVPESIKKDAPEAEGFLTLQITSECKSCSKPYLCVTKDPPNATAFTEPVEEEKQFSGYVDPYGGNWTNLYMPNGNEKYSNVMIMTRQCKFEKTDWNAWVDTLKNYYSTILKGMNPDNTYQDSSYNWQIANPDKNWTWLENEVNMYVNPNKDSDVHKNQQKTFINSIIGFFYVGTTCEEQLSSLNGITIQGDSGPYYNAEDRCNGFWGTDGDSRRTTENKRMKQSETAVINIVKWFNNKYNKNTVGYEASPISNSFVDYNTWNQARTVGSGIQFDQLFRQITN